MMDQNLLYSGYAVMVSHYWTETNMLSSSDASLDSLRNSILRSQEGLKHLGPLVVVLSDRLYCLVPVLGSSKALTLGWPSTGVLCMCPGRENGRRTWGSSEQWDRRPYTKYSFSQQRGESFFLPELCSLYERGLWFCTSPHALRRLTSNAVAARCLLPLLCLLCHTTNVTPVWMETSNIAITSTAVNTFLKSVG